MNLATGGCGGLGIGGEPVHPVRGCAQGAEAQLSHGRRRQRRRRSYTTDSARCWQAEGVPVEKGVFQAHMEVTLVNDGPVTLWLEHDSG